jgi:hypothetical protein
MTEAKKIQKKIDELYNKLNDLQFQDIQDTAEMVNIRGQIDDLTAKLEALNNSMQEIFRAMIIRLTGAEPWYYENFDDLNHGFEFNPDPIVMIQIKMSFPRSEDPAGAYIYINKFTMRFCPHKLESKSIYSGQTILLESGDCDYEFYEKILKNWRAF